MRLKLLLIGLIFVTFGIRAQNTGDFRTKNTGPNVWNDANSWQVFNGTIWVDATTFPGQNAGTYNVLVQAGHVVTNPNTPNAFGPIIIDGTLRLTQNNGVFFLSTSSLTVTEGSGFIDFSANSDLRLPEGASITVFPGGLAQDNPCNSSKRLWIGDIVFSTCNGLGPDDPISFEELMNVNGSLLSVIESSFPDCSGQRAILLPSFIGLEGTDTNFIWTITMPDNSTFTSTVSPLEFDLTQNGDYKIELTYNTKYSNIDYFNTRTIFYNNKVTIWNGVGWSNNAPTIDTRVIITGRYDGPSFSACNLRVTNTGELIIPSNQYVEVDGLVVVENNGVFEIDNNGSLVQNLDVTNIGTITYKRLANDMQRFDYVYWSSPVRNFDISNILGSLRFYWNPLGTNGNIDGILGNWIAASGSMDVGKGYIVRAPNDFPATGVSTLTTTFEGIPHNGTFNISVSRGNTVSSILDNDNLVGNPYPSAIDIASFLNKNAVDNPIIEGYVNLWKHDEAPSANVTSPFYQDFAYNYGDQYITVNATSNSAGIANLTTIGAGQGFFVTMTEGSQDTQNITFDNAMRSKDFNNNVFFRSVNQETQNKHRIWLDLVDANFNTNRTLVGYVEGATSDKDVLYDATMTVDSNVMSIYTYIDEYKLIIQGKSLPFNETDRVKIGVNVPRSGNYNLAIAKVDGLFEDPNQDIFIEDLELGIVHNLKQSPYAVYLNQGDFKNRFLLRYISDRLLVNDTNSANNGVYITNAPEGIKVNSLSEIIQAVSVFNMLGQNIANFNQVNSYELDITHNNQTKQVVIVNITFGNGQIIKKKIVF
jgi:hypothetical protein